MTPKMTMSRMRCRTLRRPSRPRHIPDRIALNVVFMRCAQVLTGFAYGEPRPSSGARRAEKSATPWPSDLLFDPRRLAGQVAQVVELGAPDITATLHRDVADGRAVGLEHALHTFAVRNLADGEGGVEAAVAARDD